MSSLRGKAVVVTGGGGGIGSAVTRLFAQEGAKIAVADIDPEASARVAREIAAKQGEAFPCAVDVKRKESVRLMMREALDRWGRIDILANVAGGAIRSPVLEMEESEWDEIVDLNLKSVFLCSQAVLPAMIRQRYGKIVSISSIYGFTGSETRANYAAAKAGVVAFTKSLALEVARLGINVNAIAPGLAATQRVRSLYTDEDWEKRVSTFPMGRAAEPDEIARAALFLVQDENRYITGQTI
ncbi:MAG: SDR family oxidoreductase, partial [Deltaproteobacteria bacterium]|nr:SDR family oxidoreductase [Deltaproteobacteria bacterium]